MEVVGVLNKLYNMPHGNKIGHKPSSGALDQTVVMRRAVKEAGSVEQGNQENSVCSTTKQYAGIIQKL